MTELKALAEKARELSKEDATTGLVIGSTVYDPLLFAPEVVKFSARQYIFLQAYRLGVPLEDAATKANMPVESAERFLKKEDTVKWLKDRALKDHIRNEWAEPARWWAEGDEIFKGKKEFSKAQMVVWQEFGDRICPKQARGDSAPPKIEINIDPGAVQEAFRRQSAIEADIVRGESL